MAAMGLRSATAVFGVGATVMTALPAAAVGGVPDFVYCLPTPAVRALRNSAAGLGLPSTAAVFEQRPACQGSALVVRGRETLTALAAGLTQAMPGYLFDTDTDPFNRRGEAYLDDLLVMRVVDAVCDPVVAAASGGSSPRRIPLKDVLTPSQLATLKQLGIIGPNGRISGALNKLTPAQQRDATAVAAAVRDHLLAGAQQIYLFPFSGLFTDPKAEYYLPKADFDTLWARVHADLTPQTFTPNVAPAVALRPAVASARVLRDPEGPSEHRARRGLAHAPRAASRSQQPGATSPSPTPGSDTFWIWFAASAMALLIAGAWVVWRPRNPKEGVLEPTQPWQPPFEPTLRVDRSGIKPPPKVEAPPAAVAEPATPPNGRATTDPLIGQVFEGRYLLRRKLGAGGMGTVYEGTQLSVGRSVAVKLLSGAAHIESDDAKRFQREARLAAVLNHPNIVQTYDFGQTADGQLYLVMEHIQGLSLQELLKDNGLLPVPRAVHIMQQILRGLSVAHAKSPPIYHRDIKPGNIMMTTTDGGTYVAKVIDFGIAKSEGDTVTKAGQYLGTPEYTAPELARGKAVDARTDVYALGVMLYEMLSGKKVFKGDTPLATLHMHVHEPVPPLVIPSTERDWAPLAELVHRALAKDPDDRPQNAGAFLQELQRVAQALGLPS